MGLDSFVYSIPKSLKYFTIVGTDIPHLYYWRKHYSLHGWMESLHYQRGGKHQLNGTSIVLSSIDLRTLKRYVTGSYSVRYEGTWRYKYEDDIQFLKLAERELEKGRKLLYFASA